MKSEAEIREWLDTLNRRLDGHVQEMLKRGRGYGFGSPAGEWFDDRCRERKVLMEILGEEWKPFNSLDYTGTFESGEFLAESGVV
jgi:hypothetical protein